MNLEEIKKFACELLKVDDSQTISYKEQIRIKYIFIKTLEVEVL